MLNAAHSEKDEGPLSTSTQLSVDKAEEDPEQPVAPDFQVQTLPIIEKTIDPHPVGQQKQEGCFPPQQKDTVAPNFQVQTLPIIEQTMPMMIFQKREEQTLHFIEGAWRMLQKQDDRYDKAVSKTLEAHDKSISIIKDSTNREVKLLKENYESKIEVVKLQAENNALKKENAFLRAQLNKRIQ